MKGYGEYKCTDEFWLPQIPAHWQFQKVKRLFSERIEKGHPDKPLLAATQNKGVVLKKDYGTRTVEATKDLHLLKLVRLGDFVISLRSFQGGIEYSHADGIISSAYTVMISSSKMVPGYFRYFAKIPCFLDLLKVCVTGIREGQNVDYKKLREHSIPIPPREEQDQIVRYLDAKVGKINKLIRIKQQQIALLKEKKQAIINQAVTKGLDPNAPMKDSGIAWIGQIPEGWAITPLKKIATVQSGITLGKSYPANTVQNYPYMCVANVQNGFLDLSKVKNIRVPEHEASRHTLQKNDVLMTEGGDPDKLGRGCLWRGELEPCLHQNHIFAVRTDSRQISNEYLCFFLSSIFSQYYFLLTSKQTTNLASTNKTKLGSLPLPLPSLKEQMQILAQLQAESYRHESLIEACNHKITTLTEYRTRLISDVVTGKVDVRHIPIADAGILPEVEPDLALEDELDDSDATAEENQ